MGGGGGVTLAPMWDQTVAKNDQWTLRMDKRARVTPTPQYHLPSHNVFCT